MTGFIERAGLAVLALIAASLVVWLAMPVGVGLLIGTLTAFALEPFQQRLAIRWRRPELAAAVCVAATTLLFGLRDSPPAGGRSRGHVGASHLRGAVIRPWSHIE